jgi:hypothetical protein
MTEEFLHGRRLTKRNYRLILEEDSETETDMNVPTKAEAQADEAAAAADKAWQAQLAKHQIEIPSDPWVQD